MIRRKLLHVSSVVLVALGVGFIWQPVNAAGTDDIKVSALGTGIYLLQGAGSNVVAMTGKDGALVIDGGCAG